MRFLSILNSQCPSLAMRCAVDSDLRLNRNSSKRARAQQIANAMHKQRMIDRLGDEIGGAHFIGAIDRCDIVETGEHDDGNKARARMLSQLRAHLEAVDIG